MVTAESLCFAALLLNSSALAEAPLTLPHPLPGEASAALHTFFAGKCPSILVDPDVPVADATISPELFAMDRVIQPDQRVVARVTRQIVAVQPGQALALWVPDGSAMVWTCRGDGEHGGDALLVQAFLFLGVGDRGLAAVEHFSGLGLSLLVDSSVVRLPSCLTSSETTAALNMVALLRDVYAEAARGGAGPITGLLPCELPVDHP